MKSKQSLFLACGLLATAQIHAATVTLNAGGDAAGASSFNAAGKWSNAAAPSAANDYSVSVLWLRTPQDGNSYTFQGASLTINTGGGFIYKGTAATNTYTIPNFALSGGLVRSGAGSTNTMVLAGGLTVSGTGSIIQSDQSPFIINSAITGSGTLTSAGGYTLTFNGASTFTGNMTVSTTGTPGTVLSTTSTWKFAIGAAGVNNTISGTGKIALNGAFDIDLTSAGTTIGDSWTLVAASTLAETYGASFTVTGFTSNAGSVGSRIWTTVNSGIYYQFNEATGVLTVTNPDADGDGLGDIWENTNFANWPTPGQADPLRYIGTDDPDFDGASNEEEETAGTDPTSDSSWPDTDSDGLKDAWEKLYFGNITAQNATGDADGDLANNLLEFVNNTDPGYPASWPDTDSDSMNDGWETAFFGNLDKTGALDTDGDSYPDLEEHDAHTDPTLATGAKLSPISAQLANRWSFNGTLTDSVGGSDATVVAGTTSSTNTVVWNNLVPANATAIKMSGGVKADSDWVKLGSNLLPKSTTPVTIELWAKQDAIQNWSRIFDFHNGTAEYLMMAWTQATTDASDRVQIQDAGVSSMLENANQPYGTASEHHIVMTLEPLAGTGGKMVVTVYSAPSSATDLGPAKGSFETTVNLVNLNDLEDALGFSPYGDNTASATYNEVRIWNGALAPFARELLHDQHADNAVIADLDNDFLPDAWEEIYFPGNLAILTTTGDHDSDGVSNRDEYAAGSNPDNILSTPDDLDGDGLLDEWEIQNFGNITAQDGSGDPDGDGLSNEQEETAGSDPNDDEDGLDNAWEIQFFGSIALYDGTDDPDEDTYDNEAEETAGSDPTKGESIPGDINGDGITDGHLLVLADAIGTASFNSGLGWDDAQAPVAGSNYLVPLSLRTPADAADYTFAGDKLVITTGGVIVVKGTGIITIPYLGLDGGLLNNATNANAMATLAGSIHVTRSSEIWANNNSFTINAPISGTGELRLTRTGTTNTVIFNAANPWTGNLNVTGGFVLGATGSLTFAPAATGVNNAIIGTGSATLNGAFNIDLSGASSAPGDSWGLITTTGLVTYDPAFTVTGFTAHGSTPGSRIWTAGAYRFDESTGILSVSSGNDIDGDGMDDTWENTYLGGTGEAATDDHDADGTDNLTEFRLGLIPNDGSSRFAATLSAAGLLEWPSVADVTFTVKRSTTLAADSWTTIGTVPGTAGTASFTDPAPPAGRAFYQIVLEP